MPMYKDAKLIEHDVSRYTEYLMQHNFLIQELKVPSWNSIIYVIH